ncbi:Alpha/beta-Hydrolases superfamily protein, putative isoform 2 [Hibiscus syriacus]|uniref:Alpha/beta-Hydrolases superfamily protein, putative isoform 2 n=1 Tax=Hibiscus syriacus TaxID=106335 RepID=A0A6A3CZL5_HIBSY|nr:epoxide hydrolase 4-like [Hibiscus syriacus]KAE8732898.1 Alpha/beta-Hydrolases superfamily protein, putative isoform 2 [Hibiscus syriacus]
MMFIKIYKFFLHYVLKLAGISPQKIEIQPGTIINFWSPTAIKSRKPAVVFLHGFALDGILTWHFQALALAKDYSVYVPDFVFFGDSVTDTTERSAEFQADCVAKGLKKLGVEKCILVGLSYGGMVGFKMAEAYPGLVESMVVSCSVIALTESISKARLSHIGFKSWGDYLLPDSVKGVETLLRVASVSLPKLPNWFYKEILEGISIYREEKLELLVALIINDKEFTLPSYHQKIHLLWGKNDQIFDSHIARSVKQQIGERASLEYIEKAGHLVLQERPFTYNSRLKKILVSLSSCSQ